MLDMSKRYYVCATAHLKSVIEAWASENDMELIGQDVALPSCPKAYELDVSCNEDLHVALKLLGSGHPDFVNGKRRIGRVRYDCGAQVPRIVIYPEVRDR